MRPIPKSAQVFGLLLLACGIAATPAHAAPLYSLDTTIPIPPDPAVNPSGQFTSFDISFFDGSTQLDYVADRNNASVDVFSAATNSFVTRVQGSWVSRPRPLSPVRMVF